MRQIVFRRQARLEFDEAGNWYEKERTGLGIEFLAEIHSLIQRIVVLAVFHSVRNPAVWQKRGKAK